MASLCRETSRNVIFRSVAIILMEKMTFEDFWCPSSCAFRARARYREFSPYIKKILTCAR